PKAWVLESCVGALLAAVISQARIEALSSPQHLPSSAPRADTSSCIDSARVPQNQDTLNSRSPTALETPTNGEISYRRRGTTNAASRTNPESREIRTRQQQ